MPKHVSQEELDAVWEAVGRAPALPAALDEIANALAIKLSRRTLQRRLAKLIEQRRLAVQGRGSGRRYKPLIVGSGAIVMQGVSVHAQGEIYIPISAEAESIKQAVRRPIHERQPVSYKREYLDAYRPNITYYLPVEIRRRMRLLSQFPSEQLPAGTYAREILDRLLIDLSWNSSRLEGNTYSLLETERLLQLGEVADGKNAREAQMILNHKDAIEFLVDPQNEVNFDRRSILSLHALLSNNLLDDPQAGGRLRQIPVEITGAVYIPLAVPQLIEECFLKILDTVAAIRDPFEQAFFAMVHLPYLQPFIDVNKRVSRFAANIPFIRQNLCPLSFVDVPDRAYLDGVIGIYELNRIELLRDVFVWAYERSCARYLAIRQSLGEPDPFRLRYRDLLAKAVTGVVRGKMDKRAAIAFIRWIGAENINSDDAAKFTEMSETELMSLHEGNFARYRIRPSEFEEWQRVWR